MAAIFGRLGAAFGKMGAFKRRGAAPGPPPSAGQAIGLLLALTKAS